MHAKLTLAAARRQLLPPELFENITQCVEMFVSENDFILTGWGKGEVVVKAPGRFSPCVLLPEGA